MPVTSARREHGKNINGDIQAKCFQRMRKAGYIYVAKYIVEGCLKNLARRKGRPRLQG